jgi:hypothetical protein
VGTAPTPEPTPSADTKSGPRDDEAAGAAAKPSTKAEPDAAAGPGDRAVTFPAHPEIWSPLVSHLAGEVDLETVLGAGQSRPAADDLGAGLTGVTGTGPDNPVREAESRGPQTFGPGQTPRCRPA